MSFWEGMEIPETDEMVPTRSTRDPEELRARLQDWIVTMLPAEAVPEVSEVRIPDSNGMSSETIMFDAVWSDAHGRAGHDLVARVAPDMSDVPVFPTYDLGAQFDVMRLVERNSDVPVPHTLWIEQGDEALGAPFFVMERVEGRVPPDVLPYNMESWLLDADISDQQALQAVAVEILAKLHSIDLSGEDTSFLVPDGPGDTALRRHFAAERGYYEWVSGPTRIPVIEDAFEWLEQRWPADEGDTVLCWGDARIGNMIFDGFSPVAVLDWEMASLGPRGIDLGWMSFLHTFFEFIAHQFEMPGMPGFMRIGDLAAAYERLTGVAVTDLQWYEVYAALRHASVMARIHARRVHFGEAEWPDDPDGIVMHAPVLREMLDGSYWASARE